MARFLDHSLLFLRIIKITGLAGPLVGCPESATLFVRTFRVVVNIAESAPPSSVCLAVTTSIEATVMEIRVALTLWNSHKNKHKFCISIRGCMLPTSQPKYDEIGKGDTIAKMNCQYKRSRILYTTPIFSYQQNHRPCGTICRVPRICCSFCPDISSLGQHSRICPSLFCLPCSHHVHLDRSGGDMSCTYTLKFTVLHIGDGQ